MVKIFGFILGIVVAVAGPAAFGVLATGGDVDLSAKETAVVYAVWALALWIAASLGAGAGALGAALAFGVMTYAMHFIPNRTTDFLNDMPGVTGGMIDGVKKAVLDGLAPVLLVITVVYAIQLMVLAVRRRSQLREEEADYDDTRLHPGRREEAVLDPNDRSWSSYRPEQSDTGEQTRVFAQQASGGERAPDSDNPSQHRS